MSYANPDAIVSTQWLAEHLDAPDVRVVDATFFHPSTGRDARAEYDHEHIPGAVYFDINEIADTHNSLPHMLPSAKRFTTLAGRLGLGSGNRIIAYDRSSGGGAAARVWWMFRRFGHNDVAVLDGGLIKWLLEGRSTLDLPSMIREREFEAFPDDRLVRSKADMLANLGNPS